MDYHAVEALVIQPMKQLEVEIIDEASVVHTIYEFTSGHPNVVQLLCRRLIDRLNEQSSRCITLSDVISITENHKFQQDDFLQTYWEAATPLEKIITLLLSHEAREYRLKEVYQLLIDDASIQPKLAETKEALDRLVDLRSILKQSQSGYEFAVKAFPRVLANTTTVEDLLAVLIEQYTEEAMQR